MIRALATLYVFTWLVVLTAVAFGAAWLLLTEERKGRKNDEDSNI